MPKPKRFKTNDSVAEAKLRFGRMTARKARLVCDLIRGKRVEDAVNILTLTHRPSACPAVLQVLKSARSNAGSTTGELVVSEVFVDAGPMQKRMRPAPMGRGVRVRKRMCHITIRLNEI